MKTKLNLLAAGLWLAALGANNDAKLPVTLGLAQK